MIKQVSVAKKTGMDINLPPQSNYKVSTAELTIAVPKIQPNNQSVTYITHPPD